MEIKCTHCGIDLTLENWMPSRIKQNYRICKKCQNDVNKPSSKKRYAEKKKEIFLQANRWKNEKRIEARAILGSKCQLCGSVTGLHFSHIVYHGERPSSSFLCALEVIKYPDDFLLLCFECHRHPEKYLKELINIKREVSNA